VLVAHDVAIHARLRIIAHVSEAVGKMKRVRTEPAKHPEQDANEKNGLVKAAPPFHGKPPSAAGERAEYRIWRIGKSDADLRFHSWFIHNCRNDRCLRVGFCQS